MSDALNGTKESLRELFDEAWAARDFCRMYRIMRVMNA